MAFELEHRATKSKEQRNQVDFRAHAESRERYDA